MKKFFKTASTLALAFALCLSLSPAAFAAGGSVSFKDYEEVFVLVGGSGYSATDLFGGLKGVMPGDEFRQVISVGNDHSNEVNIYLRAVPHGDDNPLVYDEEFEAQDGKDQSGEKDMRDETVDTMLDFLAQLEMTINWNGSAIYEGPVPPAGGPEDAVPLGAFAPGESKDLEVILSVPITMGNEYANRVGEVDWVFTIEEIEQPLPNTGGGSNLSTPGDDMPVLMLAGFALTASLVCVVAFVFAKRSRREN